jgi:hypothetical protein
MMQWWQPQCDDEIYSNNNAEMKNDDMLNSSN